MNKTVSNLKRTILAASLATLAAAPAAWGEDDAYRHNALFTLAGTTPERCRWSMKSTPREKSGNTYEAYRVSSGIRWMLTTASVIRPRLPSLPNKRSRG